MPVRRTTKDDFEDEVDTPIGEAIVKKSKKSKKAKKAKKPKVSPRRKSSRALDTRVEAPWENEAVGFDDEDEDEAPTSSTAVQVGFGSAEKAEKAASSGKFFKPTPEAQLVKFINPDGVITIKQHWVSEAPGAKKSFVCSGVGCPLCAKGHRAQPKFVFGVLNLSLDVPMVQRLDANSALFGTLRPLHEDERMGPLDKLFWSLAASGLPGKAKTWNVVPVKARDLEEDWDIDLHDARSLVDSAKSLTPKDIYTTPAEELKELAALLR